MAKDKDIPKKDYRELLTEFRAKFVRYRVVIFIVFVALVYIYALLQINSANSAQPSAAQLSLNKHASSAKIPHVDPSTVQKIKDLKDNSVNVKTLFDKARNNPFAQ